MWWGIIFSQGNLGLCPALYPTARRSLEADSGSMGPKRAPKAAAKAAAIATESRLPPTSGDPNTELLARVAKAVDCVLAHPVMRNIRSALPLGSRMAGGGRF